MDLLCEFIAESPLSHFAKALQTRCKSVPIAELVSGPLTTLPKPAGVDEPITNEMHNP